MSTSRGIEATPTAAPDETASRLVYWALSRRFTLSSPCPATLSAVDFQYFHLRDGTPSPPLDSAISIDVMPFAAAEGVFDLHFDRKARCRVQGLGHLLRAIDNHLCFRIQQEVPELYFVHAASLSRDDRATLLVGGSGSGKSTLAYALCNRGFRYLSDELAPIDPISNRVLPYPRAICLKAAPFPPMQAPRKWLRTESSYHVQADAIGAVVSGQAARLERIVFLDLAPQGKGPSLRRLATAEAAMRLYQNALNQLAHPFCGLDVSLRVASKTECYELRRGELAATLAVLEQAGDR